MKYLMGVLGFGAAATLLLVSAAMNWRFGYSLGKSEFESQVYGAASVAADCFKALLPFLILSAMRHRNFSQMLGGILLLAICSTYSLSSSLGFAALNRADTVSQRAIHSESYHDLKGELTRRRQELAALPQARPAGMVSAEIAALEQQHSWRSSEGCTNATIDKSITFCDGYRKLQAELAVARKAENLDQRIVALRKQLHTVTAKAPVNDADPQAELLSTISGLGRDKVTLALTILVSLLVEVGSALGFYIASSHWRILEPLPVPEPAHALVPVPAAQSRAVVALPTVSLAAAAEEEEPASPEKTDVEQYFAERVEEAADSSVTALALFEDYCTWCEQKDKAPVGLPIFGRQLADLGVQKAKIGGRIRYIGLRVLSDDGFDEAPPEISALG